MIIEDPDQRADREGIEGTGASSSRDGAENEPLSRRAESSASADKPPREQSDDVDMSDLESDRRRHRESVGEETETKRVMFNVLDGEQSDVWVEAEEEWCESTVVPDELCSVLSPRFSGGPKFSDISRRRKSIVCSTDGEERDR